MVEMPKTWQAIGSHVYPVDMTWPRICVVEYVSPMGEQFARLIAAAPELLAALERATKALADGAENPLPMFALLGLVHEFEKVIAKAKGESS